MISTIIFGVERLNGGRFGRKEGRRAWAVVSMLTIDDDDDDDIAAFDCGCVAAHSM